MSDQKIPEKEILNKVRKIQIHSRRMVNDVMAGEYQSAFRGSGIEFDLVREYLEGDDERLIDWNVTARTGKPYVKSYIEERELTILFMVDISASGWFGSVNQLKRDVAAELCCVLAYNAMKKNDRFGLILFSDQIELYVPPKKGKTHLLRILRELLYYKPEHKGTHIENACEFLNKVTKRKAVVFLVSDFFDVAFQQSLQVTNRRHDLVAIEISDPKEKLIPPIGLIELEDAETGERQLIDTSQRSWQKSFQRYQTFQQQKIQEQFRKYKIDHLPIQTNQNFEHDLFLFFQKRGMR